MNAPAADSIRSGSHAAPRRSPPPIPFVLCVGITGHRSDSLPVGSVEPLRAQIRDVLLLIAGAGGALLKKEQDCFAADPPRLRFVSPLADGADQIAAEVALDLGWELQVGPAVRARRISRKPRQQRGARAIRCARPAGNLHARASRRGRQRPRRLCDDRPRDRRPLRPADRGVGRASATRPRRHRRSGSARDHARHRDHPPAARASGATADRVERIRPGGAHARRRAERRAAARPSGDGHRLFKGC